MLLEGNTSGDNTEVVQLFDKFNIYQIYRRSSDYVFLIGELSISFLTEPNFS